MTAGFAAGCLHQDLQLGGYARWLARQARGTEGRFEQPLMTDPGIPAAIQVGAAPEHTLAPRPGLGSPVNLTLPRPYDNLSVPGAGVGDVLRTLTDGGGLHDLVLRGIGTQVEQALLLQPTFVSLWIGASDALGAAVSGVVLDGVTLTPADRFSADFNSIVQSLAAGGVQAGVAATIPRVTNLPYLTAIAPIAIDPETGVPLKVDGEPVPLMGSEGLLEVGDFVLLTASPLLARGDGVPASLGGSGLPLPDQVVLSRIEAQQINSRIEEYNRVIRRAAAGAGFAVADIAALYDEWRHSGARVGAERFTSDYLAGGLFSLDGVHPSPLGHALLADAFIEAINSTYGSEIPAVAPAAVASAARGARLDGDAARRFIFTSRAYKNLRFGLGVPRPRKLLRLKEKALRRSRELERRRRRERFELPAEPRLAGQTYPALAPSAASALAL